MQTPELRFVANQPRHPNLTWASFRARQMVDYFTAHALVDYGVDVYQQLRLKMNNPLMFVLELANLYRLQGKREEMVNEDLNYVTQTPSNLSYITKRLAIDVF